MLFWILGRRGTEQLFLESVLVVHSFRRNRRACAHVSEFFRGMNPAEMCLSNPTDCAGGEDTFVIPACLHVYSLTGVGDGLVRAGFLGLQNS